MSSTKAKKKRPSTSSKRPTAPAKKLPIWWIVGGVVAVALIAAMVLSFGGFEEEPEEFGTPTVSGAELAEFTGAEDPAIGTTSPAVTGADFDGNTVEITPGQSAQAIMFLAHWCSHCQAEVPRVQEWIDGGGLPENVEIISVSTSASRNQPNYPASAWLDGEGWTTPVIVDNEAGDVHAAFGNGPFPFWVFVDAEGRVLGRTAGEMPIEQLDAIVTSLAG
jgi:thiol-disulfide isomerase/thioredoxin